MRFETKNIQSNPQGQLQRQASSRSFKGIDIKSCDQGLTAKAP